MLNEKWYIAERTKNKQRLEKNENIMKLRCTKLKNKDMETIIDFVKENINSKSKLRIIV